MYNKKYSSSLSPQQVEEIHRMLEQNRKAIALSLDPVNRSLARMAAAASESLAKYAAFSSSQLALSKQIEAMALQIRSQLSGITDISRYLASELSISTKLNAAIAVNFKNLVRVQDIVARTFEPLAKMQLPSQRVLDSLATIQAINHMYKPPKELISIALQVPNSYQLYASTQLKKTNEYPAALRERTVEVTQTAGEFVTLNDIAFEKTLVLADSEAIQLEGSASIEFSLCAPNIFPMVNQHLAYLFRPDFQDKGVSITEAIEDSIPAKINTLGCKLVELIYEISRYTQAAKGESIFKPTVKGTYGANLLANRVVQNELDFSTIVDSLYFLIYEGTGEAKRLTEIVGRDNPYLNPLWILKHLRLGFRHDVEHGRDIPKKLLKVGEAFKHLIGKPRPISAKEWKVAQVKLYLDLVEMLANVFRQLQSTF